MKFLLNLMLFFESKIILIRPKTSLANDDNYRESRYFTAWTKKKEIEDFYLPQFIRDITGQVIEIF